MTGADQTAGNAWSRPNYWLHVQRATLCRQSLSLMHMTAHPGRYMVTQRRKMLQAAVALRRYDRAISTLLWSNIKGRRVDFTCVDQAPEARSPYELEGAPVEAGFEVQVGRWTVLCRPSPTGRTAAETYCNSSN